VLIGLCFRSTAAVAAENLFLRKQLGLLIERKVRPRRATDSFRFTLARLSGWFYWRNAWNRFDFCAQPHRAYASHRARSGFHFFPP
jgi:hypothetical protein